ncbi:MAG: FxsA family protein [Alphaproteobacteria bacterium]|nr:FxsA family protein [Alphaproteobacteria bacterium]
MGFLLLLVLLAIPAVEILLFVEVGGAIGALPTIGLTVLTAGAGLLIVRAQGIELVSRAQQSMERGEAPLKEVMDGLVLLIAGACLLMPGFFTDAVGGLLLIPLVREAIGVVLLARVLVARTRTAGGPHPGGAQYSRQTRRGPNGEIIIEGEFEDVTPNDPDRRLRGDSDPDEKP